MSNGFLLDGYAGTISSAGAPVSPTTGANLGNDYVGLVLRTATAASLDARVDFGGAVAIDTAALLNTNVPTGALYRLEANTTSDFTTPAFTTGNLTLASEFGSADGFRHLLVTLTSSQTYRYWRFVVFGVSGTQLEAAFLRMGVRYEPARNFDFGLSRGVRDLGEVEFSTRGALLRRAGKRLRLLGISWSFVSADEAERLALPLLERAGNGRFLLACVNSDASGERTRRLYFGPLEGNLGLTWRAHDLFEKRLTLASVV